VVQLYGSFQDESMLYLCMEFLNGGELFTLLGQKQVSLEEEIISR
jgi:serine/threonine protein kinase